MITKTVMMDKDDDNNDDDDADYDDNYDDKVMILLLPVSIFMGIRWGIYEPYKGTIWKYGSHICATCRHADKADSADNHDQ